MGSQAAYTTRINGFAGGRTSPISTMGTPTLFSIEQRDGISAAMESRFVSARQPLFWRTERRTGVTAVEGRRQRSGADWLGSGVTESNSRSEQNKEGYEQARDFHL